MDCRLQRQKRSHLPGRVALLLVATLGTSTAFAAPVGMARRVVALESAAPRRTDHLARINVTVWYPATPDAEERDLEIGPPGHPLMRGGRAAVDATPAPDRHPVVLLSPGFGGSADDLSWLASGLARNGFVVVGVDHPGNNPGDHTPRGDTAWWERPRDLVAAVRGVADDATLGPHLDLQHVGAAGFSMGGMTALALGGARIDPGHFDDFCAGKPTDLVCQPAPETPDAPHVTQREALRLLHLEAEAAHAAEGARWPALQAILAISPPVQMLDPASLAQIDIPVTLIVGDRDAVVPAPTEADVAGRLLRNARRVNVPGAAHYSFIATCTPEGRESLRPCADAPEQERAHAVALAEALALFGKTLRGGPPVVPAVPTLFRAAIAPPIGQPLDAVLLSPLFDQPFACTDHSESDDAGILGDAFGTDCLVIGGLDGPPEQRYFRLFRNDGSRNEDWYGWHAAVLAPFDGTVGFVTLNPVTNMPGMTGRPPASMIVFRRDDGLIVVYAHVAEPRVKAGDRVRARQVVAIDSNNGFARAPHVHVGAFRDVTPFQVRWDQRTPAVR